MPMPPRAFLRPTNTSRRKREMAIAQEVADELLRELMIEAVRLTYRSPFCGRLRALGRHARQRLGGTCARLHREQDCSQRAAGRRPQRQMDRITDAFNCARITHHRPGSILVVVPLDIAAVQDVAISACAFNDEDGNDKSSNGEKNHRYDQGRRVGSNQWPPPAPALPHFSERDFLLACGHAPPASAIPRPSP